MLTFHHTQLILNVQTPEKVTDKDVKKCLLCVQILIDMNQIKLLTTRAQIKESELLFTCDGTLIIPPH